PGIKISIARYMAKNVDKFKSEMKWMNCKSCGLPSSSECCSFCRIIKRATGESGSIVKEKIKEKIIDVLS
ncbi:MAG: TIGR00269 family protein, partial [Nitrososphaerota archaeon]|nr:TIGR00269 family protein [Nitrososphaerota archaeon]